MGFVIQNIKTGKYLKHNGKTDDYPFDDVDRQEDAEVYPSFPHATFVSTWYTDYFEEWRVIDTETAKTYIRNKQEGLRFVPEPPTGIAHV